MPTKKSDPKKDQSTAPKLANKYFYGTGKRKTSVARVRLHEKGSGRVFINGAEINKFSNLPILQYKILFPLQLTGNKGNFDVSVKVSGGGKTSQAEAIRHGLSRALLIFDGELRQTLKKAGLLTRDSRIKERKKYGLKKARRSPQFSKR